MPQRPGVGQAPPTAIASTRRVLIENRNTGTTLLERSAEIRACGWCRQRAAPHRRRKAAALGTSSLRAPYSSRFYRSSCNKGPLRLLTIAPSQGGLLVEPEFVRGVVPSSGGALEQSGTWTPSNTELPFELFSPLPHTPAEGGAARRDQAAIQRSSISARPGPRPPCQHPGTAQRLAAAGADQPAGKRSKLGDRRGPPFAALQGPPSARSMVRAEVQHEALTAARASPAPMAAAVGFIHQGTSATGKSWLDVLQPDCRGSRG